MDDAAIHRVLGKVDGFVCSGSQGQWIATGFALAMTRVVGFVMTEGTVRANVSLFSLHSSFTGFFEGRCGSLHWCHDYLS